MAITVYNSLTRRKEPFEPLVPGRVGMYVCGPTVYDVPHLGHARAAVAFDVIRRTFEAAGLSVLYVQNVTDVEDKIIVRAAEEARSPWEVAEEYTRSYDDAMRAIGVRPADIAPRATGHIVEMIELTSALVAAGHAYAADGDVYFAVESFDRYGALSNRTIDEMRAGERVEVDPRKRHPMDFALWKGAKPGEPSWPSPWGPGRPGWHIECSAMSMKYLGETFDIHGGGRDLIFPHHENEVAQSECATAEPFARVWLHNGFVTIGGEKMSKSLKNFVTMTDLLAEHPAPVLRYLLVTAHYRSPLDFSPALLHEAAASWARLSGFARNAANALQSEAPESVPLPVDWPGKFQAAMNDDFNTPEALAVLFDLASAGNQMIERGEGAPLAATLAAFGEMAAVLGIDPITQWNDAARSGPDVAPIVELLLALREEARAAKDYAKADAIRDAFASAGIVVEDRPGGARWYAGG